MWKPFKPPLLKKPQQSTAQPASLAGRDTSEPPLKKARVTVDLVEDSPPPKPKTSTFTTVIPRKPLLGVKNPSPKTLPAATETGTESYYLVLWRKPTTKKHKTWDGDGVLAVRSGYAYLQDVSGRDMGKCMFNEPLLPGSLINIGSKEVEVDKMISREDFMAGRPFLQTSTPKAQPQSICIPSAKKSLVSLSQKVEPVPKDEVSAASFYRPLPKSKNMQAQFKTPLKETTSVPQRAAGQYVPRHNPDEPDALVMKRPKDCPMGKEIVDVVVDPLLSKHLREHQREGVKFLYECVMGMRDFNGFGAILADEMGLGKTLQTIALLWTLLKQNPIGGVNSVIKKALIVCPVTLINNWRKEFKKWLGNERIGVLVADGQKTRLTDFTHGKAYSVMIIGYEKLRQVQDELRKGSGIDIVIADEGHRLKTASNKAAQAIIALNTDRRVILSGTPMQNDLSEFYVMVEFVNPGTLGPANTFKRQFETTILKSRQPEANEDDIEKGQARSEELASLTGGFILRRTAEILSKHLKPKTEYVLFCTPTEAQVRVYQSILSSPMFGSVLGSTEASLELITILKKVCNSPKLLMSEKNSQSMAALVEGIAPSLQAAASVDSSSKLRLLTTLLRALSTQTKEKIVIVSNYTSTLDLLQSSLASMGLTYLRLDGSTPSSKRQGLVDTFNRASAREAFAFLLSAKSGGAGINLIGASRLVLFDMDWNPATDLQAMARIHRDGQKLPVKIYRFITAGAMDEKIYQRQVSKVGLSDSIVDGKKNNAAFTAQELRDLFRLDLDSTCQTHDLLACPCGGQISASNAKEASSDASVDDKVIVIDDSDASNDDEDASDGDDDDLPLIPQLPKKAVLIPASQVDMVAQENTILEAARRKRQKVAESKMGALMRYTHVDANLLRPKAGPSTKEADVVKLSAQREIDDSVLCQILEKEKCRVRYLFVKKG